jgi:hypothetical protein
VLDIPICDKGILVSQIHSKGNAKSCIESNDGRDDKK